MTPSRRHADGAPGEQEAKVYEPESVPLLQVRVCVWHSCPYDTVEVRLAVTEAPCAIVLPFHAQEAGAAGEQLAY